MNALFPMNGLSICKIQSSDHDAIGAFLRNEAGAQPFHLPEWCDAVERACGHNNHYLVARDQAGAIQGVLPLSEVRSLLFGSALVSTGFGTGGGIIARAPQVAEALAVEAWALTRRLGHGRLELRGGPVPQGFQSVSGTYENFARDLPSDDEDLLLTIPRKQRAEIRRGIGYGLSFRVGRAYSDREMHYSVYSESVRNHGTPIFPRALFEEMMNAFGDDAEIATASLNGEPLSSVLSFYFNDCIYLYWGGGTKKARTFRANEFLYYALLRHAIHRGCKRANFGRSKIGAGAHAFKKNFGLIATPIAYAVRRADGMTSRNINPLSSKYKIQVSVWKRLPLGIANRLGPMIARGLA